MFDSIWYDSTSIADSTKIWYTIYEGLYTIEVGLPPVVSFISFVICTVKLASSSPVESSKQKNKRAAVTVTMFTGLFLVCNMPLFINRTLETITTAVYSYPGPIYSNNFMYWYSWPVSDILFTVLNAALNPVLYYYRMSGLRDWISKVTSH